MAARPPRKKRTRSARSTPESACDTVGGKPAEGGAGGVEAARALASKHAPDAVRIIVRLMKRPKRGAIAALGAARELLRFAAGAGDAPPAGTDVATITDEDRALVQRFLSQRDEQENRH